jgi:hypothetical protein
VCVCSVHVCYIHINILQTHTFTPQPCLSRDKKTPNLTNVSVFGLESGQKLARCHEPAQKKLECASDPPFVWSYGAGEARLLAFCAISSRLVPRCGRVLSRLNPNHIGDIQEVWGPFVRLIHSFGRYGTFSSTLRAQAPLAFCATRGDICEIWGPFVPTHELTIMQTFGNFCQ